MYSQRLATAESTEKGKHYFEKKYRDLESGCSQIQSFFDRTQQAGANLQIDNLRLRQALEQRADLTSKLETGHTEIMKLRQQDEHEFSTYNETTGERTSELQLTLVLTKDHTSPDLSPRETTAVAQHVCASGAPSSVSSHEQDMGCVRTT